ncbi:Tripeptidyl-peptidase 1 (TPP-1) (Tripeptidyl aminopeptidase) (Tripeptidyl-peptidase I) (TPP-I) [Durusdinium trenchii]|uniref:subtilisin n=1 Tax=Durusdinium trenchii TaxID=1381693 RepID=A0ABP0NG39_9DINO
MLLGIIVLLALRQRNLDLLERKARAVSDPNSPEYGRYLERDELYGIAGSSAYNADIVEEFFSKLPGKFEFSFGKDFARYSCTVGCVERVFSTTLRIQEAKPAPGTTAIRASEPIRLPEHIQKALEGTSLNAPLFMPPHPMQRKVGPFLYNRSGRTAPRVRPVIAAGDQFISVHFVAYCKDKIVNQDTVQNGICKNSPHSLLITAFDVLVLQTATNWQKLVRVPAVPDTLGQKIAKTKDNQSCMEFNATLGNIQNYASTTVRIRSLFSDGSVSDFSDPNEVLPIWPMAYTTPSLLSRNYNIPMHEPVRHPRNSISVAEFLGQYYNPNDLDAFFKLMGVREWGTRRKLSLIGENEPMAGSVLGGEAQLDIQYITSLAANVSTIFWSVPSIELATRQEPFLDWLMQLEDTEDEAIPLVHSVSYSDDALTMPLWFKRRVNDEFMKLALRGITVLVASGDDGVSGNFVAKDGKKYCGRNREEFPSSSPWVTSVGGTQLAQENVPVCGYTSENVMVQCAQDGEVVCTSDKGGGITSGGGFSSDFLRPWYQHEAVEHYLQQKDSPVPGQDQLMFNRSGRGFPDLAAISSNYLVLMGEELEAMSGTSASTPLIAAMVARWNEDRLQNRLPPLGFLNPLIYEILSRHPSAFNDIQIGDNRCSRSTCCPVGFGAARGWDAVSGAGSPDFQLVAKILREDAMMAFRDRFSASQPVAMVASVRGASSGHRIAAS